MTVPTYIAWRSPRAAHAGRHIRLDSSRLADDEDIDDFPSTKRRGYLHDHSPTARTMGSCRHGAYQVSVNEVIAALNARIQKLVLSASSAWR
jgi:hypothetical protein